MPDGVPRLAKKRRVQIAEPEPEHKIDRDEKSKSKFKTKAKLSARVDVVKLKSNGKGKEVNTIPKVKATEKTKELDAAPGLKSTLKDKGKGKEPILLTPTHARTFKIIAGSYEKLLYGLEASFTPSPPSSPSTSTNPTSRPTAPRLWRISLKPIFIFPAHVSCIKAVAASPNGGKWLATGSADEIVKVWDLRRRKEVGGLVHHVGSITHLTFPSRSHLLSASEDGTLCLFHARDWAVLRALKGHKGRVNALGVHPSGKLALSVGQDRTLRMWDLMRGRGAASTKLGKEGERVCWSPTGHRFAVQAASTIDLFSTKMALQHSIIHPSRVHDIHFFRPTSSTFDSNPNPDSNADSTTNSNSAEYLLVAAEDKKVTVYEVRDVNVGAGEGEGESESEVRIRVVAELVGHGNRVKAVQCITVAVPPYTSPTTTATLATTVSSDGLIRVFDLGDIVLPLQLQKGVHETELPVIVEALAEYDTKGSRLTCVAVGEGEGVGGGLQVGKRKWEAEQEEGSEGEGEEDEDEQDSE